MASEFFTSGAVELDGDGDYLSLSDSDLAPGAGAFTIECWVYPDSIHTGSNNRRILRNGDNNATGSFSLIWNSSSLEVTVNYNDTTLFGSNTVQAITRNEWTHIAFVREGTGSNQTKLYLNGVKVREGTLTQDLSLYAWQIGTDSTLNATNFSFNGKISNVRVVVGTAVYTDNFTLPTSALTNVTNTELLCCQSDSSTTAKAVGPTITANGTPSASSANVYPSLSSTLTWPTGVTWNGGSAPTLADPNSYSLAGQVFNLTTADGGSTWYGYEEVNNTSLSANYQLYSWGHNQQGELGLNNRTQYSSPTQLPGNWSRLSSSSGGAANQGALKPDGTLWISGTNGAGQLGQNTQGSAVSSPVQVPGTNWARFNLLSGVTLAVKSDNTLWAWGSNSYGALGTNSNTGNTTRSSPVQVPGTTWSTAEYGLGGGGSAGSALKTDGTLWVWGRNFYGELGQNNRSVYSSPHQVPGSWASAQATVEYTSFRVNTSGEMYAVGSNNAGQLGDNSAVNKSSPVQIPGTTWAATNPKTAASSSWAIKTDGTLFAWGANGSGQLAQNNVVQYSSPVQIPGTTWHEVSGGTDGTVVATKTDGTAWAWGINYGGGSGLNNTVKYSSPVQIPGTNWVKINNNDAHVFGLKSS